MRPYFGAITQPDSAQSRGKKELKKVRDSARSWGVQAVILILNVVTYSIFLSKNLSNLLKASFLFSTNNLIIETYIHQLFFLYFKFFFFFRTQLRKGWICTYFLHNKGSARSQDSVMACELTDRHDCNVPFSCRCHVTRTLWPPKFIHQSTPARPPWPPFRSGEGKVVATWPRCWDRMK